jgi:hypothetical protein
MQIGYRALVPIRFGNLFPVRVITRAKPDALLRPARLRCPISNLGLRLPNRGNPKIGLSNLWPSFVNSGLIKLRLRRLLNRISRGLLDRRLLARLVELALQPRDSSKSSPRTDSESVASSTCRRASWLASRSAIGIFTRFAAAAIPTLWPIAGTDLISMKNLLSIRRLLGKRSSAWHGSFSTGRRRPPISKSSQRRASAGELEAPG